VTEGEGGEKLDKPRQTKRKDKREKETGLTGAPEKCREPYPQEGDTLPRKKNNKKGFKKGVPESRAPRG